MKKKMSELPIAPITRIIKNAGAERVSVDASLKLADYFEKSSKRISKDAVRYARHARRKTVKGDDILLALGSDRGSYVPTRCITPIKPITKIIRNAGAERVSVDASLKLVNQLENYSTIISKNAISLAKQARRKTVKGVDIENAILLGCGPGPFGPPGPIPNHK